MFAKGGISIKAKLIYLLVVALLILGFNISATAKEVMEVEAEGYGEIINTNTAQARDEALRDAYRNAIEKAGVEVDAVTKVEDFEVFYEQVLTRSRAYLKDYEVLEETEVEEDLYQIEIRAEVVPKNIQEVEDRQALKKLIDLSGNPVVMTLVEVENNQSLAESLSGLINKQLSEAGYQLSDREQIEAIWSAEEERDIEAVVNLGERFGADIALKSNVEIRESGSYERGEHKFYGAAASVSIQAVSIWTGEVIEVWREERTEPSASLSKAMQRAAKAATTAAGEEIIWELPRNLTGEEAALTIRVEVQGLESFGQARDLRNRLENFRNVEAVSLRSYENETGQFDVTSETTAENLAVQLEELDEFALVISSYGREKLTLEIQ